MNKRMRELQADIAAKVAEAKGYAEGETKDLDKMEAVLDEVDRLQKAVSYTHLDVYKRQEEDHDGHNQID